MTIRPARIQESPNLMEFLQQLGYVGLENFWEANTKEIFSDPARHLVLVIEDGGKMISWAQVIFSEDLIFHKIARINYFAPENLLPNVPGMNPKLIETFLIVTEDCTVVDVFFEKPGGTDHYCTIKNTTGFEWSYKSVDPNKDDSSPDASPFP
jgi:hypothetical protein